MINLATLVLPNCPDYTDGARLIKTQYMSNHQRIQKRFLEPLSKWLQMNDMKNWQDIISFYDDLISKVEPFTYIEAFNIKDNVFRNAVFTVINVAEMIENLGAERVNVGGVDVINKEYNEITDTFTEVPMHLVYELYKVNGEKLEIIDDLYCVKCWCTSTNQEHWIWVDTEVGKLGCALEAIASTCVVYKPMLNHIKHIVRQGDVFLFEMDREIKVSETDELIKLNKKQFFKLLKSQS